MLTRPHHTSLDDSLAWGPLEKYQKYTTDEMKWVQRASWRHTKYLSLWVKMVDAVKKCVSGALSIISKAKMRSEWISLKGFWNRLTSGRLVAVVSVPEVLRVLHHGDTSHAYDDGVRARLQSTGGDNSVVDVMKRASRVFLPANHCHWT